MIDCLGRRLFLHRAGRAAGFLVVGCVSEAFLSACDTGSSSTIQKKNAQVDDKGMKQTGFLQWGATSADGAPYVFHDSSGKMVGFEWEIAVAIAALMGVTQVQIETAYEQLEQSLQSNDFDMILNYWGITAERSKVEVFSEPYYCSGQQIVVGANDPRFAHKTQQDDLSLMDLEGYIVGTGTGYRAEEILSADPAIRVQTIDPSFLFVDLAQGHLDAVLIDFALVTYHVLGVGSGSTPNKALRLIGKPFEYNNLVLAFNKNSSGLSLQKEVDQALQILKQNGTLRSIYQRWGLWNAVQEQIGVR